MTPVRLAKHAPALGKWCLSKEWEQISDWLAEHWWLIYDETFQAIALSLFIIFTGLVFSSLRAGKKTAAKQQDVRARAERRRIED